MKSKKIVQIALILFIAIITGKNIYDYFIKKKDIIPAKQIVYSGTSSGWREKLVDQCIATSKLTDKYPEIAKISCECLVDTTNNKYSKDELIKINNLPFDSQVVILRDILIYCAKKSGSDTIKLK